MVCMVFASVLKQRLPFNTKSFKMNVAPLHDNGGAEHRLFVYHTIFRAGWRVDFLVIVYEF